MIKKIYKRLDSTNLQARLLLERGEIKEPAWIQADEQYQGKGLGNNKWISEAGRNITGSVVVFPSNVLAENQFDLSVAISIAVCDLLELYLELIEIKWPNDIYSGGKKIAGLLIEHTIQGNAIKNSILGIGLNVNQLVFPNELPNPTSLRKDLGFEIEVEELSDLLLNFVNQRLDMIGEGNTDKLRDEYLKKLFRYMEFAPYKSGERWFRARITGVNSFGHLLMETEKGESLEFGFKEVEFID